MIKLNNYFFITLLIFSAFPMHAMQKGLGYLRKKLDLESHYDLLEINPNVTQAEIKEAYKTMALKCHPDKNIGNEEAAAEKFKMINAANEILSDSVKRQHYDLGSSFTDFYIISGLCVGTSVAIASLIKTWHLYKEYSSPNAILLEKMELAANKAVITILSLEFDRYNPTQDTDSLYMQFDIDALLEQLSSDKVRNQVKKAILDFDKTLEATYEACAWHYDGMTAEELAKQNPHLVNELLEKLRTVKEAFNLCRKDLKLDRNKSLEFFKAHYKKMIGFGLIGSASWYVFKKFIPTHNAPQVQPIFLRLCA